MTFRCKAGNILVLYRTSELVYEFFGGWEAKNGFISSTTLCSFNVIFLTIVAEFVKIEESQSDTKFNIIRWIRNFLTPSKESIG